MCLRRQREADCASPSRRLGYRQPENRGTYHPGKSAHAFPDRSRGVDATALLQPDVPGTGLAPWSEFKSSPEEDTPRYGARYRKSRSDPSAIYLNQASGSSSSFMAPGGMRRAFSTSMRYAANSGSSRPPFMYKVTS